MVYGKNQLLKKYLVKRHSIKAANDILTWDKFSDELKKYAILRFKDKRKNNFQNFGF